jgi:hypothetical protein
LESLKAVVQKVIREGKHGPFVVATSDQLEGSVTFSLEPTVWLEQEQPEDGMFVFLGKIRQKRAGWRAKLARFWKPSDEQLQKIERSNAMEFLYPISRQFPFDEVCEKIVRELEKRNWQVPGIKIEFCEYGAMGRAYRAVQSLNGVDFQLYFSRIQRILPGGQWNDTAGVSRFTIPKKELHVYNDESGPLLRLYVGKNWARHREKFINGSKSNSKLQGRPKSYLLYEGKCICPENEGATFSSSLLIPILLGTKTNGLEELPHNHRGRRSPLLIHTNDLGREYDPERGKWNWLTWSRAPDESERFSTQEVFDEFGAWIENNVLALIMKCPLPNN